MSPSRTDDRGNERSMLWHLIVFALALTVPILIFLTGLLWKYADSERIRIQEDALAQARIIASDLNEEMSGLIGTLRIAAAIDTFQEENQQNIRALLASARASLGLTMVLRDMQGIVKAAPVDSLHGKALPPLQPDELKSNAGFHISSSFSDPQTGTPSIALSLPINIGTRNDYALSLIVPTGRLHEILLRTPLPEHWSAAILDTQGVILALHPETSLQVDKTGAEQFRRHLQGGEGNWFGLSISGDPSFVGFSRSSVTRWQVAIAVSKQELEAPWRQSMMIVGAAGVGLVCLALLCAWLVARRLMNAINQLSQSAISVEEGRRPRRILTSVKEINLFGRGLAMVSSGFEQRGIELAQSKQRLARILDATPCGIIEVSAEGIVTYANAEGQALRPDLGTVIGLHYHELVLAGAESGQTPISVDDWPLSRALKGEISFGYEMTFETPDTKSVTLSINAVPMRAMDGTITGALAIYVDVTARVQMEEKRRQSEIRLRTIVETVPVGIVFAEAPDGTVVEANLAAEAVLNCSSADVRGTNALNTWRAFDEHGKPMDAGEHPLSRALAGSETRPELECLQERNDGTRRWLKIVGAPLRDKQGAITGAVAAYMDIDDIKRAQEQQLLMNRELHHRVKNTLATIQGIANLTARAATDITTFRQALADRIISLSRTHTLLVENSWSRIPLRNLVRLELEAFVSSGQAIVSGADVWLPSDVALALGMAFHELTANAIQYGALSAPAGKVSVCWDVQEENRHKPLLTINWAEQGGPAVTEPQRSGFGSQLLANVVARQLDGNIAVNYKSSGVEVRISIEL